MRLGNDLMKFRTMRFMKQVELKFGQPVRGHHCNKYLNTASHFSCVFLLFESLHKHVSNEFNYELSSNTMDFNKKKLIACFFVKLHFLGKKIFSSNHLIAFIPVDIPQSLQHISSIICGLALAYSTLGVDFLYSLCFTTVEYIVLLAIPFFKFRKYGVVLTIFCLAALIIGFVSIILLLFMLQLN